FRCRGQPAALCPGATQPREHVAQLARLGGYAVAERDDLPSDRRDARPRHEEAHDVQRVGSSDDHHLGLLRPAPHGAQRLDRLGERELLADEPADEAPAPHLASRLECAERAEEHTPARHPRLASHELADDDAVAAETLPREAERIGIGRTLDTRVQERPAARRQETSTPAADGATAARAALAGGYPR